MRADQFAHMGVALEAGAAAKHDGDHVTSIAMHRGDQIEAGSPGKSGLDAVDAFDLSEQMIVIADGDAVIDEGRQRKIFVIGGKRSWMARPSRAWSRAVVIWSSSGRPEAL